jgi:hypothetical protein
LEWVTKLENMQHAKATGWNPRLSRLGKKSSELHKQRQREALIGRTDCSKPCRCVETGQIFVSCRQAAGSLGIGKTSILRSLSEHKQVCGKYTFEYI